MAVVRWGFAAVAVCLATAPALAAAPAAGQGDQVFAHDGRLVAFNEESVLGGHAIQLFDAKGRLVRDVALADFLPKDYIAALPSDANGLHWRRDARLAADAVEFDVATPGTGAVLHFSIGLGDGLVRTAQIREYLAAADQARALAARTASRREAPALAAATSPASP